MRSFFRQAFQQSDVPAVDQLHQQFVVAAWDWFGLHQRHNIQASMDDMWARTVLDLVNRDRPFTETLTTKTYMMNTPIMSLLAYWDAAPTDDSGNATDSCNWLHQLLPNKRFIRQSTQPIDPTASMDPADANFLNFYEPVAPSLDLSALWCQQPLQFDWTNCVRGSAETPCVFDAYENLGNFPRMILRHLFGARFFCDPYPQTKADPRWPVGTDDGGRGGLFSSQDWNTWRPVTIRAPAAGEQPSLFMNLPALRQAQELVLTTDYSGFMSTPAFLYKWPTNASNQHRVTLNQALIVGLGRTFAPNSTQPAPQTTSVANLHAQPGTTCYSCHQVLDPMTDFFRQSYNLAGQRQNNASSVGIPPQAVFALDGAPAVTGHGIAQLAQAMAQHPGFATAWTQKLCHFANATPCDESDPEFIRVAKVFAGSGYNFRMLVRTLFSSPLVTWATSTESALAVGTPVSVARKEHFCASMSQRLNWPDACQLRGYGIYGDNTATTSGYALILRALANTLPQVASARGVKTPLMPTQPNLFTVSATDQLCRQWSLQLVDPDGTIEPSLGGTLPTGPAWTSAAPDQAIVEMLSRPMGLPAADPRSASAVGLLRAHHQAALATGASATDALRSTFVVACRSATATSLGL